MEKQKRNDVAALLRYAGGHKGLTFLGLALSGLAMLLSMVPYICIWLAARDLIAAAPDWTQAESVAQYGWLAFAFAVGGIVIYFLGLMCTHLAAFRTASNIRKQGVARVMKAPLGYFDANASGLIRGRLDAAAADTETLLAHNLADIVGTVIMFLAMLVLMFVFDWRMGAACLLAAVISIVAMFSMMGGKNAGFFHRYQREIEKMSGEAVEYVRGISVIKVFGQSVHSIRRFKEAINAYRDDALAFTMACKPGYVGFNTVVNAAFLVLIPAALIGMTSAGDLTAFIENFLFYLIFAPACASVLNKIMYMSNYKMQAMESMRRIDAILLAREQSEAQEPQMAQGSDICFEHVTFTYPTGEQPAVSDVSFTAKAGTVTALVGHSGSGKTTIGTLVPRFYDVQEGRITLGGVELSEISRQEVMGKIAFVFQNPKLLKTTLEENIRGGCKNASREDILRAARLAQCDDILAKLPEGIDSIVGGKGVYLSGGEVQRVAIARAILKDAPVIILDEVTAFADPENEVQIQAALKELTKGKTVIMIAHRLSTIQDADQILVMKAGRLVEQGTHQELLGKNGEYAHMWADYNQAIAWKIDRKEEVKPC